MSDHPRARRVADRIKTVVAGLLESRIKDPRLGFTTITDVKVTGDLQQASVFYTVMGEESEWNDTAAALQSARGMIRSEVGKQLQIRLTPTIEFIPDVLQQEAAHIEGLLAKASARDEELAAKAQGARHAGEADPYRSAEQE